MNANAPATGFKLTHYPPMVVAHFKTTTDCTSVRSTTLSGPPSLRVIHEMSRIGRRIPHISHWKFGEGPVEKGEARDGDILILSPAGRIDNDTSTDFQTKLLAALTPGAAVLVDFSAIEYV